MIDTLSKNSVRFIVTGDLHWTGKSPKARKDDYREALKYKLREIFMLAEKCKVEGIIIPGDLFDSTGVSISVITDLMQVLAFSPVPIYTIGGNHDFYSGNSNSLFRTPYGILYRSGLVNHINDKLIFAQKNKKSVRLTGESFDAEITDENIDYYLSGDKYNNPVTRREIRLHVTHGMLLEEPPGYELPHTLMEEVAEQHNAPDILINGHEHQGFGIKKIDNTLFINPGSIGRIKANTANINRQPQVALLAIPADGDPHADLIELESAASGHKVLSREHIKEQQRKKAMTEEFLGLLAENGENDYMEMDQIMNSIADKKNLPKSVVEDALDRVEKAREGLDHAQRKL